MHVFVFKHLRLLIVNICSELSEHQDLFFLVDTGGGQRRLFSGACIGFLCSRQELGQGGSI